MKGKILLGLSLLVVAASGRAHGQQPQADPLFSLDEHSRIQIQAILDSATDLKLPVGLLNSKAHEGVAKGAAGSKVLTEVRTLFKDVKLSRAALGDVDDAAIEAGADALYAQVIKPEDLAKFKPDPAAKSKGATPARSPAVALMYLSDLIQNKGVAREDATPEFLKLWDEGRSNDDFKGLWQGVDQDILSGVNPTKAFQNRVRAIPPGRGRGESPSTPAESTAG